MTGFESVFGAAPGEFLAITLIFMGGCAFMTGQALAITWRPLWQVYPYALLLGAGNRFVVFALFQDDLFQFTGYVIGAIWLLGVLLFAYRVTRVRQMATQYPWLYERANLLNWRAKR